MLADALNLPDAAGGRDDGAAGFQQKIEMVKSPATALPPDFG